MAMGGRKEPQRVEDRRRRGDAGEAVALELPEIEVIEP